MNRLEAHRLFAAQSMVLFDLFNTAGEGFYIPSYQREYTWEEDNIQQLFDDIINGVLQFCSDKNSVTFLGTLIFVTLSDRRRINPIDIRAVPTAVQIVVDGQQRLATLAMIAINLSAKIKSLKEAIPKSDEKYIRIHEKAKSTISNLSHFYAVDFQKGNPSRKPKLIREGIEKWTYVGDESYNDDITKYIAKYIPNGNEKEAREVIKNKRIIRNLNIIDELIFNIEHAHNPKSEFFESFPSSTSICGTPVFEFLWEYEDESLLELLITESNKEDSLEYRISSLSQLLIFSNYLMDRCIVTRLQPQNEDWGFDMFQSLNTTGTPLTAIETFLPTVMWTEKNADTIWEKSPSCEQFERINKIFENVDTYQNKTTITNELLLTSALVFSGKKLPNKFSEQRRWIIDSYNLENSIEWKRDFVKFIGDIADFYEGAWRLTNTNIPDVILGLEENNQKELASFLITFLREANSKLSAPILAAFHRQVLNGLDEEGKEFIESIKACAAFFALWRSAFSTSGLDNVYRNFFSGHKKDVKVSPHCLVQWDDVLLADELKDYFKQVLINKGITNKRAWINRTERFLTYDNVKIICKFILFLTTKDCIPDPKNPGLVKIGTHGTTIDLFKLEYWKSSEFKTLEHVAPQKKPKVSEWDDNIYSEGFIHSIGNLILLSRDLNNIINNKNWKFKKLHYMLVGQKEPEKIKEIEKLAKSTGIRFTNQIKNLLQRARYNLNVAPILEKPDDDPWDLKFIKKRAIRISDIAWEKLAPWLNF